MHSSASKHLARHHLLLQRAAQHRASPTLAERKLWALLRKKQLGVWFRRQHVVAEYILDFVALTPRLVIEVDGGGCPHSLVLGWASALDGGDERRSRLARVVLAPPTLHPTARIQGS